MAQYEIHHQAGDAIVWSVWSDEGDNLLLYDDYIGAKTIMSEDYDYTDLLPINAQGDAVVEDARLYVGLDHEEALVEWLAGYGDEPANDAGGVVRSADDGLWEQIVADAHAEPAVVEPDGLDWQVTTWVFTRKGKRVAEVCRVAAGGFSISFGVHGTHTGTFTASWDQAVDIIRAVAEAGDAFIQMESSA